MGYYLAGIIILLLVSGFFSATETAFTSINRIRMKNMANDDIKNAELVLELDDNYDKLLSTILIGNNLANIATTAIATVLFIKIYGEYGATIATIVVTVAVLIFGEITPKNIAKENPEKLAMATAPLIRALMVMCTPLNWLFSMWKKLINKIFKSSGDLGFTEDELVTMIDEARQDGNIDEAQKELITNAIEFNDIDTLDVITPRVGMVAIELGTPIEEIGKTFLETGFSRIPVYEDDLDNIVGVLNQKDFHNYVVAEKQSINDYIKPVAFVAESMKAAVLLKKMQKMKTHIAIIIDEYGGTSGLVTMEDIIEELVGKIYDEHDIVQLKEMTRLYDGSYTVSGGANAEKMFEYFGEEIDLEVTTVNGWIAMELDKLPAVGDQFDYETRHKHFHVKVTKADSKRALMTHITVKDKQEEDEWRENR